MRIQFLVAFLVLSISIIGFASPAFAAPNPATGGGFGSTPATTSSFSISWTAPVGGDSPTGYTIEGALEDHNNHGNFGAWTVLVADTNNVTEFNIVGLDSGEFYKLRVISFNNDGASTPTAEFNNGTMWEQQTYQEEQDFNPNQNFAEGQEFVNGQDFDEEMDFSGGSMNFGNETNFSSMQNFDEAGTFSGNLTLNVRTTPTTEWADIFGDLKVAQANGIQGYTSSLTEEQDYEPEAGQVIYGDFTAVTAGEDWSDNIFTDGDNDGKIDCASAGACELSDLTTAVTYADGTNLTFDLQELMVFGAGSTFVAGQTFAKGQTFDQPMDFSAGAVFGNDMEFNVIQPFNEAGAFSILYTLPLRTTPTVEWADVFSDLVISQVSGYTSNMSGPSNYATSTLYQDFSATTSGSFWNDIVFTDTNANGKIDCASATACELADMTQAVTYAAGTTTKWDYVIEQDFGSGAVFTTGQTFGAGQTFDEEMDFSTGAFNFSTGTVFNEVQNFEESGTFSKASAIGTLPLRTTPTTEWADVFSDLSITSVAGYNHSGTVGKDYNSNSIIYADFSATTAGPNWNDAIFTDFNGNGDIDCGIALSCELSDMKTATTYASGATVWFDQVIEQNFDAGVQFPPGQTFGVGQTFDQAMDFSAGAMTFGNNVEFTAVQNFEEAGTFSGNKTLPVRTVGTIEWADVFSDLSITTIPGFNNSLTTAKDYVNNTTLYADFTAVTAGSFWNDIVFTDTNANGDIDCVNAAACELADMSSPVKYASGSIVTFDYIIEQQFGAGVVFAPGQTFGKGQTISQAMDFSGGAMNFGNGMDFNAVQPFNEAGTFSGTLTIPKERTIANATTEWADVFSDLGITSVPGYKTNLTTANDYTTNKIIYGDFIAVTSGNDWSDNLFTDTNSNGDIDCASASACELADLTTAVSYASGTNMWFDYVEEQEFGAGIEFMPGQAFGKGQNFDVAMDFSTGAMTFDNDTDFNAIQNFNEAGAFSGQKTLAERTVATSDWFTILGDISGDPTVINGFTSDMAAVSLYETNKIIYADFTATTAGSDWNDILFTDANTDGIIQCTGTATSACELADLATPVTYAAGTKLTFDYLKQMTFGPGTEFMPGQDFGKGQVFGEPMDFSTGAMVFPNDVAFEAMQNFHQAGTFSGNLTTVSERTIANATTEWADVFSDLGITSVPGYKSNLTTANDYTTNKIIYGDFIAVTSGNDWSDNLFTDTNSNGDIDCASALACELADLTTAVSYAAGTNVWFDYVEEMNFGAGVEFYPGQTFGPGQSFDEAMDFSTGAMTFDTNTDFDAVQNFNEAGTFSGNKTLPVRTTATTEWADVFSDLSITTIAGTNFAGTAADYVTNKIIYADFSAVTAGNDWNDVLFTDTNSNGDIDCASASACELADMTVATTYAVNSIVTFDYIDEMAFGAGTEFAAGQDFGKGQTFDDMMDFTGGAMTFATGMEFAANQSFVGQDHDFNHAGMEFGAGATFAAAETFGDAIEFDGAVTFDGANTFGEDVTFGTSQDFDIFESAANIGMGAVGPTVEVYTILQAADGGAVTAIAALNSGTFTHNQKVFFDFDAAPTVGDKINALLFTDGVVGSADGIIQCTGTGSCELADLAQNTTLAGTETLLLTQDYIQAFSGTNVFGAGTEFAGLQTFSDVQNFTGGAMTFAPGMGFAASQSFAGQDHDFVHDEIVFGASAVFEEDEIFGDEATFSGAVTFEGENTFGEDTTFGASQNFAALDTDSGALGLTAITNTEVEFADIFEAFDTVDDSIETSDTETFGTGMVQVEFSAVSGGATVNDVLFTDTNGNGIIDCTSDKECELADLGTGVIFNNDATITFSQDLSQTFVGSNTFGAGTVIADNQDFSAIGTQDFTAGAMTFGAGVEFAAAEDFSDHTHTFDSGTEFNGDTDFKAGQVFAGDTLFNTGQTFDNAEAMDFTADGITFGTDTSIDFGDNDFTFGTGATFAVGQDFTDGNDHVFTATDLTFGAGTDLPAGEAFGEDVNFTGNIDFPDDQAFPEGAEFSGAQVFDADHDPVFDDFSTFGDGIEFAEALDFKDAGVFEGDATFVGNNTFGEGTTFKDGVTFTGTQTFSGAVDFGNADLSAATQTIPAGSQFEEGTTFANNQALLANTVLDSGLLLSGVTCTDATCTVSDADVLSSGEKIQEGVTVAAISATVTNDTPIMSIEGLGISLAFEEITDDGTIDVQIMDPADVLGVVGEVSATGSLTINANGGDEMQTVSSVIDFDYGGTASSSGEMTIVLPYSEGELGDIDEGDLEVLHYDDGEWITETDCLIDQANNEITCIVDSID